MSLLGRVARVIAVGVAAGLGWSVVAVVPAKALTKPDATNTGVPVGTTLTPSGSFTVTKAGAVVENKSVNGRIDIKAHNVTVRRTKVTSRDYFPIRILPGFTGTIIEDVEIDGDRNTACVGQANYIARRLNVHGCTDGFKADGNVRIESSYIHDLSTDSGCHCDGIQVRQGSNIAIVGNTIERPRRGTSTIKVTTEGGRIDNVFIDANWLDGGAYSIYITSGGAGEPTNDSVTNNRFGRRYVHGLTQIEGSVASQNNVWDDTGEQIPLRAPPPPPPPPPRDYDDDDGD